MALLTEEEGDVVIPPSQPESGVPILAHKLWVGNIDKRITELVYCFYKLECLDSSYRQETAREDPFCIWEDKIMEIYVALQWSKSRRTT